jgi:phage gp16-like protein
MGKVSQDLPADLLALRQQAEQAKATAERLSKLVPALQVDAEDPLGAKEERDRKRHEFSRALKAVAASNRAAERLAASEERRRRHLAQIHIGAKALGLDAETYRAQVGRLSGGRCASAGGLTDAERLALLGEYRAAGWRPIPPRGARRSRPTRTKQGLSEWVRALLADAQRLDDYADSIARKRFDVERWEWLDFEALAKLGQMLQIDARRHGRQGHGW